MFRNLVWLIPYRVIGSIGAAESHRWLVVWQCPIRIDLIWFKLFTADTQRISIPLAKRKEKYHYWTYYLTIINRYPYAVNETSEYTPFYCEIYFAEMMQPSPSPLPARLTDYCSMMTCAAEMLGERFFLTLTWTGKVVLSVSNVIRQKIIPVVDEIG